MPHRRELARIAALSGYRIVAARLGLDTRPLLKAAGITPAILAEPEQFVPARPLAELLEASAREARCPTFGLQMALERKMSDSGLVSVLLALQPNFEEMLRTICRYRNAILPVIAINVEKHHDIAVVALDLALSGDRPFRQAHELLVGAMVTMARLPLGSAWHPECTHFAYPDPVPADLPFYRRLFASPLQFNADFNGFSILPADLVRTRDVSDPVLARHAETLVAQLLQPDNATFVQRVRQAVIYLLGSSKANLEDAAALFAMHPRTLQRRLDAEGVTFRELVHQARSQLAARFLANRNLSVTEVAEALGYSSTGAFSRWHRHEFGIAPTACR
jgi:AraC-like DNA-binding protein